MEGAPFRLGDFCEKTLAVLKDRCRETFNKASSFYAPFLATLEFEIAR